jgi:hypothetical protein
MEGWPGESKYNQNKFLKAGLYVKEVDWERQTGKSRASVLLISGRNWGGCLDSRTRKRSGARRNRLWGTELWRL